MRKLSLLFLFALIFITKGNSQNNGFAMPAATFLSSELNLYKSIAHSSSRSIEKKSKQGFIQKLKTRLIQNRIKSALKKIEKTKGENLSTISLMLGIIGIALLFIPTGFFGLIGVASAIGAIIVGFMSKKKGGGKDWKAIAGISLGFATILLLILAVIVVISVLSSF